MVKRNSSSNADSLDLLLDTLTNSFGAFLLVALIIALLVTDTSQSEAAPTNVQLKVLENLELEIDTFLQKAVNIQKRIDFLYAEVKKLPATISEEDVYFVQGQLAEILTLQKTQTESLNEIIELNAAIVELADEIVSKKAAVERERKLRDRVDDIVQDQREKLQEITKEIQSAQKTLVQLKEQLNQKIQSAQRLRLSLKEQLAEAEAGNQYRQIVFPRVTTSSLSQFAIILKDGLLHIYDPEYLTAYLDASYLVPSEEGCMNINGTRYRFTKGSRVVNARDIARILNEQLSGTSVNSHYIKIFVWAESPEPISFRSWNSIRIFLSSPERRFKYDLVPMENGGILFTGSRATGRVQ